MFFTENWESWKENRSQPNHKHSQRSSWLFLTLQEHGSFGQPTGPKYKGRQVSSDSRMVALAYLGKMQLDTRRRLWSPWRAAETQGCCISFRGFVHQLHCLLTGKAEESPCKGPLRYRCGGREEQPVMEGHCILLRPFSPLTTEQNPNSVGGRTTKVIAIRALVKSIATGGREQKENYTWRKSGNSIGYRLWLEREEVTSLRPWDMVPLKRLSLNQKFREYPSTTNTRLTSIR